jgi:superfamily II DNA or RNA helicase
VRLPILEADYGYLGSSLFLPLSQIAEGPVRRALTFGIDPNEPPRTLVIDHPHHLEVPRNYKSLAELAELGIEVIDLRPTSYRPIDLEPIAGFEFRKHQKPAWAAMLPMFDARQDFILRLDTGRGKTVMGWRAAAELKVPTLIISAQKAHLRMWERELHHLFRFNGTLGWISDDKMEYDRDIVFSTVQTLVRRHESGKLPFGFGHHFGLTIYDEVHHQAAKWFSKASDLTRGMRVSLTATLTRRDRCEGVVLAHLGQVAYDDPGEDTLEPTICLHETDAECEDDAPEITDRLGQYNVSRMRSFLAGLSGRNRKIVDVIRMRLGESRKVYVLSHSKDHVYELVRILKDRNLSPGIITGDEKDDSERLRQLSSYDVVVATVAVGKEAYNRPELSALVLASPMGVDHYAPTEAAQSIGRVLRPVKGKPDPVVDLFADPGVSASLRMLRGFLSWCYKNDWNVRGDRWTRRGAQQARSRRAFGV